MSNLYNLCNNFTYREYIKLTKHRKNNYEKIKLEMFGKEDSNLLI